MSSIPGKGAMYSSKLAELMARRPNHVTEEPEADSDPDPDNSDHSCGYRDNVGFYSVSDPLTEAEFDEFPFPPPDNDGFAGPFWVKYYDPDREEVVVSRGYFNTSSWKWGVGGVVEWAMIGHSNEDPWTGPVIRRE